MQILFGCNGTVIEKWLCYFNTINQRVIRKYSSILFNPSL